MKQNLTAPTQIVNREELRALVREELRTILGAALAQKPAVYSSRRGRGPEGMSEDRWKALAPTIPGAVKRGRWWVVSRDAFEAYEASQVPAVEAPKLAPVVELTRAEAFLRAGLRASRG